MEHKPGTALRYDGEKPKMHHVHPFVWQTWLEQTVSNADLINISLCVNGFFYYRCKQSLESAWCYVTSSDMEQMVRVLEFGAKKYAEWNWMQGMAWSRVLNSFRRHILAIAQGEKNDPESGISHMGHVCCNLMFLTTYEKYGIGKDDRPNFKKEFTNEGRD